jgi:hypothetical protein
MAAAMINAAVAQALYQSQLETLENFKKFLAAKDDVDMEFMEELIDGFKATLEADKPKAVTNGKGKGGAKKGKGGSEGSGEEGEKKKRAPSAYTMYIQYQMNLLKKENPDIKSGKELMSKAVEAWGELSDDNKTELKRILKEDPTLTSEQLVTKALGGGPVTDEKEEESAKEEADKESDEAAKEPDEEAETDKEEPEPEEKPKAKKAAKPKAKK